MRVSVIIPALNEEASVGAAIDCALAAGADEVIVADGGSSDHTVSVAMRHGARVVQGERMRAKQLNRGAHQASGEALIFLHADTLLPDGAADLVRLTVMMGAVFGGFRIDFLEKARGLGWTRWAINTRTKMTKTPWGDQAQFVHRETFLRLGGFREIPIMEDYELASRMKREGPSVVLPIPVRTSARRFLQKGLVKTAVMNWTIIIAWHFGVKPERLARWYRG